ncbi:hypothetical protein LCGC14_2385920 [marine sediment metagenome]|uniref:Uncharacterized protein n=1 Tax=marine sediment metagenome TaxID=412755 RepID=A0A0F9BZK9_9ZZZZ
MSAWSLSGRSCLVGWAGLLVSSGCLLLTLLLTIFTRGGEVTTIKDTVELNFLLDQVRYFLLELEKRMGLDYGEGDISFSVGGLRISVTRRKL